jgi:predicted RNA-binding Zn-ribbon protein involved in translation (DUF1610 family)
VRRSPYERALYCRSCRKWLPRGEGLGRPLCPRCGRVLRVKARSAKKAAKLKRRAVEALVKARESAGRAARLLEAGWTRAAEWHAKSALRRCERWAPLLDPPARLLARLAADALTRALTQPPSSAAFWLKDAEELLETALHVCGEKGAAATPSTA